MIRRLDAERLENILRAFFQPAPPRGLLPSLRRWFGSRRRSPEEF
jgi:hypothetical protein